jgi:tetratricopeptide (TPR) repeat protein
MQDHKATRLLSFSKAILLAFMLLAGMDPKAPAQQDAASHPVDLGIIVTSSEADAAGVLRQLNAGWDFGVLAKEKSIDPTANDGGYMGKFSAAQLRPEMANALAGLATGQLSRIFQIPSGFAILKILTAAPPTEDLDYKKVGSLTSSGVIHLGAVLDGLAEADSLLRNYPKLNGWDRDLHQICEVRKVSYASGVARLNRLLDDAKAGNPGTYSANDILMAHLTLGRLYAYMGNMADSVKEVKIAYDSAPTAAPNLVSTIEEALGAGYLHLSEMENGIYLHPSDLDIFPPLNHKGSYAKKDESKLAVKYFTEFLAHTPNDLEVKWLLNLAYMTLGEYPAGVPAAYLIPESDFTSKENIGRFVDVAPAAGLSVFRNAGGVIVDDFENNGLLDVVASSQDECDPLKYFHNNGDGTFSDRSVAAGLGDQLGALNLVQADYNNDGCMDILVLRGGWAYPQRKSLLRNNCNGTFTDVTDASGLGDTVTATHSAVWADIDNDGYLDLFIGNENSPSQLFRNKGDGTFEDISHAAGIDRNAYTKGVTAADYDHDGYVDFYVSNQFGPNFLYHNNGNGTFTEVGRQAGVQAPIMSFATWFFDYDNDGWPDIFAAGYLGSIEESMKTYVGGKPNAETLKLYRNKHDGTFEDVTAKVGLDKVYMVMGAGFGDIDNDGYLDIYLGMGNPSVTSLLPHTLLHNKEGKSFVDITQSSGTGELHKGHAIVFADLERNGNEDIIANCAGAIPADKHALRVFRNPGNNNDWINVHAVGVKTNRSGVGAEIKVTVTDDGGAERAIYRTVGETSSFGANPLEQHIGLGHNAHIVALDIFWPVSNTHQHFTGVDKNQFIEIKEFANEFSKLNRPSYHLGGPVTTVGKEPGGAQSQTMQIEFSTNPDPPQKGSNAIRVKLTGSDGAAISGAEVAAVFSMPAMPEMAMDATETTAKLAEKNGGLYEGTGELAYGGKWEVTVTVKQHGQLVFTKKLSINAKGGM